MQLPYKSVVQLLGIFPKGSVNTLEKNALRIYVDSSTVHHSKKKEPGRCPTTGEKIKKRQVCLHSRILYSHKEK